MDEVEEGEIEDAEQLVDKKSDDNKDRELRDRTEVSPSPSIDEKK